MPALRERLPSKRYWLVSLVVHGLVLGALAWVVRDFHQNAAAPSLKVDLSPPPTEVKAAHAPAAPVAPHPAARAAHSNTQTAPTRAADTEPAPGAPPAAPAATPAAAPAIDTRPPAPSATDPPPADSAGLSRIITQRMTDKKRYPRRAQQLGMEGRVVIEAVINERGNVVSADIRESSGFELLDQDALALLKSVAPITLESQRIAPGTKVLISTRYQLE